MTARLEHANFTVADPDATAAWMCALFGWHVRWSGAAMQTGRTVHVGTDTAYLALFSPGDPAKPTDDNYQTIGGLNHIAVVVDDIAALEDKVTAAGFTPINHADYEPGRRFYFHDGDGIEYEVVQYD
ncbi:VOC family protein [Sedimentitalea nanhaiensis]|uniref:Catechol 2,3-dioxygenase n=1 Tax=Sedimentitalea nanhaiensis TaxID=999627 RepID=A0A1I6XM31_9RHOB|nr:VOC family protein [Sedimentitalea nanhaiensis]SFT39183.1 Catechol 2,3-dioxygenase [Sedimentitalea nanhaiensis]